MAKKAVRKDSKGYVLKTGECQRADGRYSFACTNRYGNTKLISTDQREMARAIVAEFREL